MGAAYFIVLDNDDPGFDPFVNGKAIAREVSRLARVGASIGVNSPDEYVSMDPDDAAAMAEEFGGDDGGAAAPAERWFDPDEGLNWVEQLRAHLQSNAKAVKDANAVLAELAEFARVLTQAKQIGARWHLAVDY